MILSSNKIIHRIIKFSYVKKIINTFFISFLSIILRTIFFSIISIIVSFDNLFVDFIIQCLISILLCIHSDKIRTFLDFFNDSILRMVKYFINNYSETNFRIWKNYFIFISCFFGLSYFHFFEINSFMIQIYILQYALCYFFLDVWDNQNHMLQRKFRKIFKIESYEIIDEVKSKKVGKHMIKPCDSYCNIDDDFVIIEK